MAAKPPSPTLFFLMLAVPLLLLLNIAFSEPPSPQTTPYEEEKLLLRIKNGFGNPPALLSWKKSTSNESVSYCRWDGIQCIDGSVAAISLSDQNLTTLIPAAICDLKNLSKLDLSFNPFAPASLLPEFGNMTKLTYLAMTRTNLIGEIPESFGQLLNLVHLDLAENALSGRIPTSIWGLEKLEVLYLYYNKLSGEINVGNLGANRLIEIDLTSNNLSGPIPQDFGKLNKLYFLLLSNNQFSGKIPVWTASSSLPPALMTLYLSNNHLSGEIPEELGSLLALWHLDLSNNQLSGKIPEKLGSLPALSDLDLSNNQLSGEIPVSLQQKPGSSRFIFGSNPNLCSSKSLPGVRSCSNKSRVLEKLTSRTVIIILIISTIATALLAAVIRLFWSAKHRGRKHTGNGTEWGVTFFHSVEFTVSDITRGLTDDNLIGTGVYKIALHDHPREIVAVKRIYNGRKLESALEKEFMAEVKILGSIRHANIIKLLCIISSSDSKLLVYEYMENQGFDRWLHNQTGDRLDWPKRLRIAIDVARGLCYMHHDCFPPIVHRDVKSSNILLDSEFQAKIADFGLARVLVKGGDPETVSAVAGSFGYMAPECGWSRQVNLKTDVYSFGVVLLELTVGRKANEGSDCESLAEWAWRYFQEGRRLADMISDEMMREPSYMKEMEAVLKLGLICTGPVPENRPFMKEVLQVLLGCSRTT